MSALGLLGIIIAHVLLIVLVYKDVHMVVVVTNRLDATTGYSSIYLGGMGIFVADSLPTYL